MIKRLITLILLLQICLLFSETKNDFFNKGNKYQKKEDFKNAIEYYTKAIKIDDKFIEAYIERAISYSLLGDYNNALKDLKKHR